MNLSSICKNTVPGLLYYPSFIPIYEQNKIISHSTNIIKEISEKSKLITKEIKPVSHNLYNQNRIYKLVPIKDISNNDTNNTLNAQYFCNYGGNGHELNYFIGESNIPYIIREYLINKLCEIKEIQNLKTKDKPFLRWKCTMNAYYQSKEGRPGFGFHKDIETNGIITCIFTFLSSATFQIRKEDNYSINKEYKLLPGSLVLLSNESRYNWEHQVLPEKTKGKLGSLHRISIVLGCTLDIKKE